MNALRKITAVFSKTIPYNTLLVLLVIAFCLLIFPMLYIAKWDVPAVDDYYYGTYVREAVISGGSLPEVLQASVRTVKETYFRTQGTVSAVFLFSLMPATFGDKYYAIVPYLMLSSLTFGVCYFCVTFFGLFSAVKKHGLIIAITLLIGCTQFLPSPVQAFYWYNGSVYYTFFFGLSLILYSLLIRVISRPDGEKAIGKQVLAVLLCVIIALSNLITALTTAILLLSLTAGLLLCRNNRWKNVLLPLVFFGAAFAVNISAPGFRARQSMAPEHPGVLKAILDSFPLAVTQITTWNRFPIIALYVMLCPLLWKTASGSNFSFRFPGFLSAYSFCLLAAMDSPTIYGGIEATPGRVENIRYFAMLILCVINLFYWMGWLGKNSLRYVGKGNLQLTVAHLAGVILLFLVGLTNIPSYRITSLSAVQSYKLGQIGQYKHVYNQRMEILNDPEIRDAVLREYPRKKPFVLFFDDITENPDDWRNVDMSRYFKKDSIRLRTPDEAE